MASLPGHLHRGTVSKPSKIIQSKKQIIAEYKLRLKNNINSLNQNFKHILTALKVQTEESAHKNNQSGRMTEYYAVRYEMSSRAALMMRAADELLKLNNDIKEFLILRDFNFLSNSIQSAKDRCENELKQYETSYDSLRVETSNILADIDKEDEEQHENAAVCHVEIANIYGRTGNQFQQRLHSIEAAKLFFLAKYARFSLNISVISEYLPLMNEFYLKAIHKAIHSGYTKIAGMTCLELACKLLKLEKFEDAHRYLVQGNRFIQSNTYVQLAIIDKMVTCGLRIQEIDELLSDLVAIWNSIMRNQPLQAECNIILLHLKQQSSIKILPKSFLTTYDNEKRNPKSSVLDPDEYEVVTKFIKAIKGRDFPTASSLYLIHFIHYLNKLGKTIAKDLVESIRPKYSIR
uniref:Mediator of RNA polymerase II transcription subunit 22 n=1 Tax=Acrobeloides nanus TaxID=290746 RepID=A0A914BWT1_9BILA